MNGQVRSKILYMTRSSRSALTASIKRFTEKYGRQRRWLLEILREVQNKYRMISSEAISVIADEMDLSRIYVQGTATFYHFLSRTHRGKYTVYLNTSITAEMAGLQAVAKAFEKEAGIQFGQTTKDKKIGLRKTSCIGMSDQEPAALINKMVFTRLTPEKVKRIVAAMKMGHKLSELVGPLGDGNNSRPEIHAEVENNIRLRGPVFFSKYMPGKALRRAMEKGSSEVIDVVKRSSLRGRGGAGFPTGQKWGWLDELKLNRAMFFAMSMKGSPGLLRIGF